MEKFPLISTIVLVCRLSLVSFSYPGRSQISLPSFLQTHSLAGTFKTFSTVGNFDVLLTVHLSIFILVINQLDAQNFVLQ